MENNNIIREKKEILEDIKGSEHIAHEYGDRFRGWYLTKTISGKELMPLGYKDMSFEFTMCDYNYKFIMPGSLKFNDGIISYDESQRLFGVFRFPVGDDGRYCAPLGKQKNTMELTKEDIKKLMNKKGVLTFDAYKIPQFGFKFLSISDFNINEIEKITSKDFCKSFSYRYKSELLRRKEEIKDKILSSPNYLLILEGVLNRHWKDMPEVSKMTNNILYMMGIK